MPSTKTLDRICDKAILDTLAYRNVFDAGVTYCQLGTFLLTDKKVAEKTFDRRLKNLIKSKKVQKVKNAYSLYGTKPKSWSRGAEYAHQHIAEISYALSLLKTIKWIKLLTLTGSVAAYSAQKNDDIDIFIVAEPNRLWLTRFFVVMYLKALKKYRSDRSFSGKLCPNIFVDENNLEWPKDKHNVYIAHEILLMHPVISRDNAYFKFLAENNWVFEYFKSFHVHMPAKFHKPHSHQSKLIDFCEFLAMSFQLWYMKAKKTTEITSPNLIHFNREDHTQRVLQKYGREYTDSQN